MKNNEILLPEPTSIKTGGKEIVLQRNPRKKQWLKKRGGTMSNVSIEEPPDDPEIIEIDLREGRPHQRKTIGEVLDQFIDNTMEAIDPLIQKYTPVIREISRVANDPAVQNFLVPGLSSVISRSHGLKIEQLRLFHVRNLNLERRKKISPEFQTFPIKTPELGYLEALLTSHTAEDLNLFQTITQTLATNIFPLMRKNFIPPSRQGISNSTKISGGSGNQNHQMYIEGQRITIPFGEIHIVAI